VSYEKALKKRTCLTMFIVTLSNILNPYDKFAVVSEYSIIQPEPTPGVLRLVVH
jgi:hypothetical protein